jgi:hypothetical protein
METKIKKRFSLYDNETGKSRINATFFDMISGKGEPKQTKGLAGVFYWNHQFLFDFLNLAAIREKTKKIFSEKNITAIEVYAEKSTTDRKRADIVITLDEKKGPLVAVIIEAKGIGAEGINTGGLSWQIKSGYLEEDKFPGLRKYEKLGVVLTKYTQCISGIAGVTWDQVIELLDKHTAPEKDLDITSQYRNFLTNIGGAMKFYEKEVLSLPAGRTSNLIQKYQVYSCTAENAKYKTPLFMAFREKDGGAMSTLYKLEAGILLNPRDPDAIERLKSSDADPGHIIRIQGYINDHPQLQDSFSNGDHLFYVFSTDCNIDLSNKPKPAKNTTSPVYYTLKEMLEEKILPLKADSHVSGTMNK